VAGWSSVNADLEDNNLLSRARYSGNLAITIRALPAACDRKIYQLSWPGY